MQILMVLHIAFMVIATGLILTAVMIAHGKKPGWLKKHKSLAATGVLSAVLAALFMIIFKLSSGYDHFQSIHAIAGLCTLIILMINPVFGVMIPKGPKGLKIAHRTIGRIVSIAIIASAALGLKQLLGLLKG